MALTDRNIEKIEKKRTEACDAGDDEESLQTGRARILRWHVLHENT